ncbi:peptide-methionine (S)-S-oxide reductase MsrA [Rufibacter latericius]|uniref:peptide-methionine (S)-S-oxide reductase n=1 Tax=Rufibacter latericius TaxID=2487040 RepID=A0A3M9MW95_9BACT|nr:peptide-methionine (S)-S-oxide reductase [Rufibacter latericius]RNI29038.1 peptide-methionine (S)-S-oxide reductase [Rufibacter latericius]
MRPPEQTTSVQNPVKGESSLVTFSMGCFWKPEALFGGVEGVQKTWVGYVGGDSDNPTYWNLGQHIETVQLEINTSLVSYRQLLDLFFTNHSPTKAPWKRQYTSAIFFRSPGQEEIIRQRIAQEEKKIQQKLFTLVLPFQKFYLAEERHQKWYLQRNPALRSELLKSFPNFPEFLNSTAASQLNAYLAGFWPKPKAEFLLQKMPLSEARKQIILAQPLLRNVAHCS